MKFPTICLFSLLLTALTPAALAEDPMTAPSTAKPAEQSPPAQEGDVRPGRHHGKPGRHFLDLGENLTEAEREQLKTAMKKADEDPELIKAREEAQAAGEKLQSARRAALLKADPSIEPILNKIREARKHHGGPGDRFRGKPGKGGDERGLRPQLPEDVRKRLDAARDKAKLDPAVVDAKGKLDAAKTREERSEAARELRKTTRAAIIKIDPDLEKYLTPPDESKPPGESKDEPAARQTTSA